MAIAIWGNSGYHSGFNGNRMGISSEYHWNIMARNLLDIKSATICISKLQMNRRIWKVFKFQSLLSNPTNSKKNHQTNGKK